MFSEDNYSMTSQELGSFGIIHKTVLRVDGIKTTDIAVYGVLAAYANVDERACFLSTKTIMSLAKIKSEITLHESLRRLQKSGLVSVEHRRDNNNGTITNKYQLNPPQKPARG